MTKACALLVDLDGTLVDTSEANFEAYRCSFNAFNINLDRETFDSIALGRNWREFVPELLSFSRSDVDSSKIAAMKRQVYEQFLPSTKLNEKLAYFLRFVRPICHIALVTSASQKSSQSVLKYHKITDLFDAIITGDDVEQHKPHPEAYILAAQKLGVEPHRCVIVEDSSVGLSAGLAFGGLALKIVC